MKIKALILIILLHYAYCTYANIWYAKPNSSGSGTSWTDATSDLQFLINSSMSGDTIFVAVGTYKPKRPADSLSTVDIANRKNSFVLKKNVKLYGGFPGVGNPGFVDRNFSLFPTILSGDIGNENDSLDNCYHVILSMGDMGSGLISGFIIKSAYGHPYGFFTIDSVDIYNTGGGGIYLTGGSNLTISDVILDNHHSDGGGGGIACENSSPVLKHVMVTNCSAMTGGGMVSTGGSVPNLYDVTFINNTAAFNGGAINSTYSSRTHITRGYFYNNRSTGGLGGAISNETTVGTVRYENVIFDSNYSLSGGAMYNSLAVTSIVNCVFKNNYAIGSSGWGGAITCASNGATSYITNSTFYGNTARRGGALWAYISQPKLTNCICWNNTATEQFYGSTGDFFQTGSGLTSPIVKYSLLQPMDSVLLNTGTNIFIDPQFKDPATGDLRLICGSPAINSGVDSIYFPGQSPDISSIEKDLSGNARISNWKVDMGAYEYRFEGDSISAALCKEDIYTYKGNSYSAPFTGYVDTFVNQEGCDSFTVLHLSTILIDTAVSLQMDTLFATAEGDAYQWIDCESNNIIQDALDRGFKPAQSGNYKVVITLSGCTDTSSCHYYQPKETGVKRPPALNKEFTVYPNPANESITIDLRDIKLLHSTFEIADMLGNIVIKNMFSGKNQRILLGSLSPGVYLLKTKTGAQVKIVKF